MNNHLNQNNQQNNSKPNKHTDQDLINIAMTYSYYYDKNNIIYSAIQVNNKLKIVPIESMDFKSDFASKVYALHNYLVPPAKIKSVNTIIYQHAKYSGKLIKHYNRFAKIKDSIYINLHNDNETIIHVDKYGWKASNSSDIFFKPYPHQEPLPFPKNGKGLKGYLETLGVTDHLDQCLLSCWAVASFFTDISRAHLWLIGESGGGKTSIALGIRNLIDPVGKPSHLNKKIDNLAQILDHNAIPIIDNFSEFNDEISNLFCGAYTGTNFTKKAIYTDDGDFTFSIKKPIIFTTLTLNNVLPDLIDRTFFIVRDKIYNNSTDTTLLEKAQKLASEAFGELLDAVSYVLRNANYNMTNLSRTGDFEIVCTCAAEALGYEPGIIKAIINRNYEYRKDLTSKLQYIDKESQDETIVRIVQFIINQVLTGTVYATTMKSLYEDLSSVIVNFSNQMSNPAVLGKKINRIKEHLNQNGIEVIFPTYNSSKGRIYKFVLAQQNQFAENILTVSNPIDRSNIGIVRTAEKSNQNGGRLEIVPNGDV